MADRTPSFFLLVPGPWTEASELVQPLVAAGFSASASGPRELASRDVRIEIVSDPDLADGFKWMRMGLVPDSLVEAVRGCPSGAVVEVGIQTHEDPAWVASVSRALRDAGGVGVRVEASGAAMTWDTWLELLDDGVLGAYRAGVLIAGAEDGALLTRGMHQFDLPDVEIHCDTQEEAVEWLDALCCYQLEEAPVLRSGQNFRVEEDAPARSFERWPDHRHAPGDGRHNPFGLWRLLPVDAEPVQMTGQAVIPVPPLVTVLKAAEEEAGRPLSREEVEAAVNDCTAMPMEPRDALILERSRGHADIEPMRAWEQWQIVRGWSD